MYREVFWSYIAAQSAAMDVQLSPEQVLQEIFGYPAFRNNQQAIIQQVMEGRDALVLMPTGGGKSLCYQVPAVCLPGVTIVVSPLIALMKDQVDALNLTGVRAAYLNSTQHASEQTQILRALERKEIKILYMAPERLVADGMAFIQYLKNTVQVSLFAIDEAHCISQWGHDFRPEYRELRCLKEQLPDVPLIALTATADGITRKDIAAQLGLVSCKVFENSFNRPNLTYYVKPKYRYQQELIHYLGAHRDDSGIIYCLSRQATEKLAEELSGAGFAAAAYHAGMDRQERESTHERFLKDEIKIVVATIAFGMGINKSNVRFVIHADLPKNIEGYYQETGRAGRDGLPGDVILFYGQGDYFKLKQFAQVADNPEQTAILLKKLDDMVRFCEITSCRRQYLLQYFGEQAPDHCGNCDNCLEAKQLTDQTVAAQKILSTVTRLQERFGLGYVVDVLRGSKSEKIPEKHRQLSVYGIGKDLSKETWIHYGRQLITQAYLQLSNDAYPVLRLTEKSKAVLFQGAKVLLNSQLPAHIDSSVKIYQQLGFEKELLQILKQVRYGIAQEERVPPYLVLSDSTLMDMATYLPLSATDLERISGFGMYKIERYGQAFLEKVQDYCNLEGLDTRMDQLQVRPARKVRVPVREADTETRQQTLQLYEKGLDVEAIAATRGLATSTVENHLCYYISTGKLEVSRLVNRQKQELIRAAIAQVGKDSLRKLKDVLPDQVSYGDIRMILAAAHP